jgi:CheY-like chemotaxis protein
VAIVQPTDRPAASQAYSVLIVEDNPVNTVLIVSLLQRDGWNVVTAENGSDALARHAESVFDLILMDCQMPVMDGFEATTQIRAREGTLRRTPIIALTASTVGEDRAHCFEVGMDDIIAKPIVDFDAVRSALRSWAEGRGVVAG